MFTDERERERITESLRAYFGGEGGRLQAEGDPDEGEAEVLGDPWAEPPPARSTNRRVADSQPMGERGGEDTADWGWLVKWSEAGLGEWRDKLNRAQKAAQARDWEGSLVQVGAVLYAVRPAGGRFGGIYFNWILEGGAVRYAIMDREGPSGETPNVRVHLGAMVLLQHGLETAHKCARLMIEAMGGEIVGEKLSRIDPCLDVLDVHVREFCDAFFSKRAVCRARKGSMHWNGQHFTGFTVGTGAVRLRVYDKKAETGGEGVKWDSLVALRYDGEIPNEVTRVEFQLRRRMLKEVDCGTVEAWLKNRAAVVDYLVSEWFRLTDGPVDRDNNNQSRYGPSELWQRVSEGFAYWAGLAVLPAVRVLPRRYLSREALVRQAVGCVTSAAAVLGWAVETMDDVRWSFNKLSEALAGFEGRVIERGREKRQAWEAACCAVPV